MSSQEILVDVDGVSKRFTRELRRSLRYALQDIGRELIARDSSQRPLRPGEFRALDDVSFSLRRGEALAVIGANGAGKTTLLKIMNGLMKPDQGEIRLHGRVAALIELGTGFDPILTGRENVDINGAILGLSHKQVQQATEEIVAFAEIEEAIDAPVRTYSSGMIARLAFAVAALLEPDVLLIDEVFAVGDIAFQRKCVRHIKGFLDRGGALLLVSHNTPQIQSTCQRGLVLEHGRCTFAGDVAEALSHHLSAQLTAWRPEASDRPEPDDRHPVTIDELLVSAPDQDEIVTGGPLRVELRYRSQAEFGVIWGFSVWTADQWVCVTGAYDTDASPLRAGSGSLRVDIPSVPLLTGRYLLRAVIAEAETLQPLALLGYEDAAVPLLVTASATMLNNGLIASQQLTRLDVRWG